ncbi:hypothetical protein [Providencia alcalifaciens]|uniref:hypothetical protein n=1 Tax=Providencia alcalifaciens TaxID=126385 RepID=UPI002B058AB6|nr:hypothetical protein [Providencia alcalifaciens]
MKNLKSLILVGSLLAVSFSTFAYHGNGYHRNGNGTWCNGSSQSQYDRPCDGNYRGQYMGRHQGMMQYSTAVQTAQPEEALKKITAEVPKGENNKKYMVKVAVIEISPSLATQEAQ